MRPAHKVPEPNSTCPSRSVSVPKLCGYLPILPGLHASRGRAVCNADAAASGRNPHSNTSCVCPKTSTSACRLTAWATRPPRSALDPQRVPMRQQDAHAVQHKDLFLRILRGQRIPLRVAVSPDGVHRHVRCCMCSGKVAQSVPGEQDAVRAGAFRRFPDTVRVPVRVGQKQNVHAALMPPFRCLRFARIPGTPGMRKRPAPAPPRRAAPPARYSLQTYRRAGDRSDCRTASRSAG